MEGSKNSIQLTEKIIVPGIAIGQVLTHHVIEKKPSAAHYPNTAKEEQEALLKKAFKNADEELSEMIIQMKKTDSEKAGIFFAHREILRDVELSHQVKQMVSEENKYPAYAVETAFEEACISLEQVDDLMIASRTADLRDVKNRLLRILQGGEATDLSELTQDVIIVAHELLPSDTAMLDRKHVKGIITETGGIYSHTAIIARSYKIPTVLGVKKALALFQEGIQIVFDAVDGEIVLEPDAHSLEKYFEKLRRFEKREEEGLKYLGKKAMTKDGFKIEIGLNISSEFFESTPADYDFVGLFRTEFLFLKKNKLPTEQEQFIIYKQVLEQAQGKTVTLRTLDIGGDKKPSYLQMQEEENPALGARALRFCLCQKDIFMTQLRAALRASAYGPLQLMFPMIGGIEDFRQAKAAVQEVMQQLGQEGLAYQQEIKLGIMIEIPSIAMMADLVVEEVDFASIGTNDLAQYLCAADRMNADVSEYYRPLSPAMLRLMGFVFEQFRLKNKPVSVCGELAGSPREGILLVGLGAKSLSMNVCSILQLKAALAGITTDEANKIANDCKNLQTVSEVEAYLSAL